VRADPPRTARGAPGLAGVDIDVMGTRQQAHPLVVAPEHVGGGRQELNVLGAERHDLIIIVALGESIVAIGLGVASMPISSPIVIASILGRPEHWTLSVFISDQASFNANVPFAAAMALFLTVLSLVVVGIVMLLESRTRSAA